MHCVVLTADQHNSRSGTDLVPETIAELAEPAYSVLRPFERTAGDEVQAVFTCSSSLIAAAINLASSGHWSVGLGVGNVEEPLPASTRAGRGPAYIAAREAVTNAKRATGRLTVKVAGSSIDEPTQDSPAGTLLETLLRSIIFIRTGRSAEGQQACDLAGDQTGVEIAAKLGITPQAVSGRLRIAGWHIEQSLMAEAEAAASALMELSTVAG